MKMPASLADFGVAAGVAFALRDRPVWAVAAALGIALHPAVIDVSAWWGQYESIYVLGALIAFILATGGRPALAAVALGVAVMTKPQALPFLVPFAAWFLGRYGARRSVVYGAIGLATIALLWLPFVPSGGPQAYARNLAQYQGDIFSVLSLRAWNPWWLVQEAYGKGEFISDSAQIVGPLTLRAVGYVFAAILEFVVFLGVWRAPTERALALGMAAASLVAFCALTTMHERYAYPALIFLALLIPDRRILALWLVLGVTIILNLLAAAPPTGEIAHLLPTFGAISAIGSIVMVIATGGTLVLLLGGQPVVQATRGDDGFEAMRAR
jgi:Gpi18-like mannosyltransferase